MFLVPIKLIKTSLFFGSEYEADARILIYSVTGFGVVLSSTVFLVLYRSPFDQDW